MASIYYYLNDMVIELKDLQNGVTLAYLNAATVTVTIVDESNVEVTGVSWPQTMVYVAASDGIYRVTIDKVLAVTVGEKYTAKITAAESGLDGYWELDLRAEIRGRP